MYKIIYPIQTYINGSNLNNAVKDYVKIQNDINLTKLIIQNENLYNQSIINYIHKNGKKIAHINTIPLNPLYPLSYYIKEPLNIEQMPERLSYAPLNRTHVIPVVPPILPPVVAPFVPTNFAI